MTIEKINLIDHFDKAVFEQKNTSLKNYKSDMVGLLKDAFEDLQQIFKKFCADMNQKNENDVFYYYQEIFAYFSFHHSEIINNVYSTYKLFCQYAKTQVLDKVHFKMLANELNESQIIDDFKLFAEIRKHIDPYHYSSLILSFCYLFLLRKIVLTESEYNMFLYLLNEKIDIIPTYNEFYEKVYKNN